MTSRTVAVEGVESESDESKLVAALEKLPGVEAVTADRSADVLTIEGDAEDREIRKAISDAGFRKGKL